MRTIKIKWTSGELTQVSVSESDLVPFLNGLAHVKIAHMDISAAK
jgi:hypothetical protein